jgi:hypothetical protein
VTASPGGKTASGPGSPVFVSGLTNGTSYTFTVTATSTGGTSAPSGPSAAVVPVAAPDQHTVPAAPGGSSQPALPSIPLPTGPRPPQPTQ